MGRKNKHSAEEFHELVLTTVEQHLAKAPASELSLRKLAAQIDYAPGMILSVFKSYNNLLLLVNARTLDSMRQFVTADLPNQSGMMLLHHYAQRYLQFAIDNPYLWQLVFDHKMANLQSVPDWMQTKIDSMFALIANAIDTSYSDHFGASDQASVLPPAEQLEISARTIWASVHGITQLSLQDKLFNQVDTRGDRMIDNLLHNYFSHWNVA